MIKRLFSLILILVVFCSLAIGCSGLSNLEPPRAALADPIVKSYTRQIEDTSAVSKAGDAPFKLVTGEYAPFTGEALPNGGLATEIVTTVFNELGWTYTIAFEPWARGVENLDAGKYFATFPYYKDDERAKKYLFSDPIILDDFVFFVRSDANFNYSTPEDLTGHTICYPGGAGWSLVGLQPIYDSGKIKMERPASLSACFNMLKAKRVEIVFAARAAGLSAAMQAFGSMDGIKVLAQPFASSGASLMIEKSFPNGDRLLNDFNNALNRLEADGTLAKIRAWHTQS